MIHTNDRNHRVMMLKSGYTGEDIRHVHIKELEDYGYSNVTF